MKCFRIALVAIGLFATFGFYPITLLWPSGFAWHGSGRSEYLEMIVAIYATLGVFLVLAARNPEEHRSLISFTIWSSIVHGGVMAVQALQTRIIARTSGATYRRCSQLRARSRSYARNRVVPRERERRS